MTQLEEEVESLKTQKQHLIAENIDNDVWFREMLADYKIPYDDHTVGRRYALNNFIHEIRARADELQTQLDAWHTAFGTTQLTHAEERLKTAEKKCTKQKEILEGIVASCVHPEEAFRAVFVSLKPIRNVLKL